MEYYRSFDQIRVNELTVIKYGFFKPNFELADGQFVYGRLSYFGFFRQGAMLNVANKSWTIRRKGMMSRALMISNPETGEYLGEARFETWTRRIIITINNSFNGIFTTKKVFSRLFTMMTETEGDVFTIEPNIWKFKTPFKVSFDQSKYNKTPDMPLLILLGVYMALLRQQQAAAAH